MADGGNGMDVGMFVVESKFSELVVVGGWLYGGRGGPGGEGLYCE
jgi:hypothetical protein